MVARKVFCEQHELEPEDEDCSWNNSKATRSLTSLKFLAEKGSYKILIARY